MYLPEAPFEVSTTNRYTIDTQEASITARAELSRGELVRHLTGVQIPITKEEEAKLDLTRRDFSIVMSSRKRTPSLFLGPARFANHDCDANARLRTSHDQGIEVVAQKEVDIGQEITVSYGDDYFGPGNRDCLCATCERYARNGWAEDTDSSLPPSSGHADLDTRRTSRSGSSVRTDSRASSTRRAPAGTPSRKRKVGDADMESSERSPKRPEFDRIAASHSRRASSSLSNEIKPSDIPDPTTHIAPTHNISSPPGYSLSASSMSSNADGMSASTAPTSVAEREPRPNPKYQDSSLLSMSKIPIEDTRGRSLSRHENGSGSMAGATQGESKASPRQASNSASFDGHERPSEGLSSQFQHTSTEFSMPPVASSSSDVADGDTPSMDHAKGPNTKGRRPGDYTLTPRLLSFAHQRWVQCRVCDEYHVQSNAYQTRYACPRCERHSKLYGFRWPKTDKVGKFDPEERILDHRQINRFVGPNEEKSIKKGKEKALKRLLKQIDEETATPGQQDEEWEDATPERGRVFRKSLGKRSFFGHDDDFDDHYVHKRRRLSSDRHTATNPMIKIRKHKPTGVYRTARTQLHFARPKRRYVRSGLYTRENKAKAAAIKESQRQQHEREEKQRKNNVVPTSKVQLTDSQPADEPASNEPSKHKTEMALPAGMKPSKWKGWVLIPATGDTSSNKKAYDATGSRIRDDPSSSAESEVAEQTQSMVLSRPKRSTAPKSVVIPRAKRRYVRSGKYVGVAERRKIKRGMPPPPEHSIISTQITTETNPPSHLKCSNEIQCESARSRAKPARVRRPKSPSPQYSVEVSATSSSESETESETAPESVDVPRDEPSPSPPLSEAGSDFEKDNKSYLRSLARYDRVKKKPEARLPVTAKETRSVRRASMPSSVVEASAHIRASTRVGKLKRPGPSVVGNGNRPCLPRGWAYVDEEIPEDKQEDDSDPEMVGWNAEALAYASAQQRSSMRRSRPTM